MPPDRSGPADTGAIVGFDHVALPMRDAATMVAFYRSLGLEVTESRLVVQVQIGSQMVNFHRPEFWRGDVELRAPAATPPCGDLCVVWEGSPDALETLLRSAGATVVEGPTERRGGRRTTGTSWYVRDPDGNLLEFIRYPPPSPGEGGADRPGPIPPRGLRAQDVADGPASDRAAITALVHAYAVLVDDGDVDGVAALFEHATWRSDSSDGVRRGAAEVRPVYEQLRAASRGARTKHLLTNLTVTVEEGATAAGARCSWTVLAEEPEGGIRVTLSGQYLDRFAKVGGVWRFADRRIVVDLTGG